MKNVSIILAAVALSACSTVERTTEEDRMARAPDACTNPKLVEDKKPIWCVDPGGSMVYGGPGAAGATVIHGPHGEAGGRSAGGVGRFIR
jgi:hypothetical protein